MKKRFFLTIFFYHLLLIANCQTNYWQQQTDYKINVALDDTDNTLDGFIKMDYYNNSPDTLHFIWMNVWPDAYKNDHSAFSDQLLENGRTDFYFSNDDERGYIDRLDFKIGDDIAETQEDPQYQDIIKVILPHPLAPRSMVEIETPFHEKLPNDFSGNGYINQSYQITQWYPQLAVYDSKGWHPMPYLSQGGAYNEFGDYEVTITLPNSYVVATNGLQIENGKAISSDDGTKTLRYQQKNITGFVWFADKNFLVEHDAIQTSSGKTIDAFIYHKKDSSGKWQNSLQSLKQTIVTRSKLIGEYPYNIVSIVEAPRGASRSAAYPAIASIADTLSKKINHSIEQEVGYIWFSGALATDERTHAWMNKGMNSFYDNQTIKSGKCIFSKKMPANRDDILLRNAFATKTNQPIEIPSADFSKSNYSFIPIYEASLWMMQLQNVLGDDLFDSCMRAYYRRWQFKHPYPDDFKRTIEDVSKKNIDSLFSLLYKKNGIINEPSKKAVRFAFLFDLRQTDKYNYISIAPAVGYNMYDNAMLGAIIHNYQLPMPKLAFIAIPLYATNSKQWNGTARISYSWYPGNQFQKIELGISGSRFSTSSGIDSNGNKVFGGFYKAAPFLRFTFKNKSLRSTLEKWIELKTFLIGENPFSYTLKSTDSNYYPTKQYYTFRYLNQLTFSIADTRVLYPYNASIQLQQGAQFYRINLNTDYFFNYPKGGGLNVRLFAAKFGYIGATGSNNYNLVLYQPKLTATRGDEDYTYSNYFIGRNEFAGFASQQIMMQDGGLKLRTDEFQGLQGRSDDWVASANFNTTLPQKIVPLPIPLKLFFDIGTYAAAWNNGSNESKFLYVGGLQLSLFKNIVNIYAPLMYSDEFSNSLKTVPELNGFWQKVSFSIDIQNIRLKKITPRLPLD